MRTYNRMIFVVGSTIWLSVALTRADWWLALAFLSYLLYFCFGIEDKKPVR